MKQVLLDKHGLEPSNLMQLYREKTKVHETTRGVHALSYNDLPAWALSVRKTNHGSIVKIVVEPIKDIYLSWCYEKKALWKGAGHGLELMVAI